MASSDDLPRSDDVAPGAVFITGTRERRERDSGSASKRMLRLVVGSEIVEESHARRVHQKRVIVNRKNGSNVVMPVFGYRSPVGDLDPDIELRRTALRAAMGRMSQRAAAKACDIPYSTFQRLFKGKNPPKIEAWDALSALPGYDENLLDLREQARIDISASTEDDLRRVLEIVGTTGFSSLVHTIEGLARAVGGHNVDDNLKSHLLDVQNVARQVSAPKREIKKVSE